MTDKQAKQMWLHIKKLEDQVQQLQLRLDRQTSPRNVKTSEEKDLEIQAMLMKAIYKTQLKKIVSDLEKAHQTIEDSKNEIEIIKEEMECDYDERSERWQE